MAILPIIKVPNPVLEKEAKKVRVPFDKQTQKLIIDLKATLMTQKDPPGVGLAAPQIGKSLKIFAIQDKNKLTIFINPKITWFSKRRYTQVHVKKDHFFEGCLSVPEVFGPVNRANSLKIKYFDENGKEYQKKFEGLLATYIQHEYDHINGILFTRRVLEQGGNLYKFEQNEWRKLNL